MASSTPAPEFDLTAEKPERGTQDRHGRKLETITFRFKKPLPIDQSSGGMIAQLSDIVVVCYKSDTGDCYATLDFKYYGSRKPANVLPKIELKTDRSVTLASLTWEALPPMCNPREKKLMYGNMQVFKRELFDGIEIARLIIPAARWAYC